MTRPKVVSERRTWAHMDGTESWRPMFIRPLGCGCLWDEIAARVWEPCMAHESEGHVSAVSVYEDGSAVWRCLAGDCKAGEQAFTEAAAIEDAKQHWAQTRRSGAQTG